MSDFMKRNRGVIETIALALFEAVAAFFFLLESPLHIWHHGESGTDSSVFQTVAFMMERGYMPYRDSFDHKGPLMYIINYIGRQISVYRGVWVIEYFSMVITLLALYKTARLKCNKILSCVCVLTASTMLIPFFEGGNLTEEYAMPFIAVALFIFLDYFLNEKIDRIRLLLCGFCFGGVCLLRPNMVSVWIVFGIAVFAECFLHKRGKALLSYLLFFMAGVSAAAGPVLIWMISKGILVDCVQDYLLFNMLYCSVETSFSEKWEVGFCFFSNPVVMLSVAVCIYLVVKSGRALYSLYLCYMGCTLCLVSISGRQFNHYGMVLIPAVVFPVACLLAECEKNQVGNRSALTMIVTLWLIIYLIIPGWSSDISLLMQTYANRKENEYTQLTEDICYIVGQKTAPDEKISVYGNWDIIYLFSGRMHATKYSYQLPVAKISSEIKTEYFRQLEEERPKIIVVRGSQWNDGDIRRFLTENCYELIWQEDKEEKAALIFEKMQ